jgi:predicted nucleic acid-binding protein
VSAEVFVDTSAWYPLAVAADPAHAGLSDALRARVRAGRRVVTTNLVVAETHAMLVRRAGRRAALAFVRTVGLPPNAVVWSTPDLEERAVTDWLERFRDQDFSFADAVSLAVMAERGIEEALALDRHFTVAGFRAVQQ